MPEIQNIGQRVNAVGPIDYAQARPNQAFAQAGKEAGALGDMLDKIAEQDAAVEGLKTLSDFDAASEKRMQELQQSAKTPDGFGAIWQSDWDQRADTLIANAPNDRVARFLDERLAAGRGRALVPGVAWEASQKEAIQSAQFGQSVNQTANGIMRDPGRFPEALGNLDAMLKAAPFDPAKREALWNQGAGQYAVSYLNGLPPDQALERLNAGEVDKYIGADAKIALTNHFEAKIREAATQGKVATNQAQELAYLQGVKAINDYSNGVGDRPVLTPEQRAAMGEDKALRLDVQLGDADAKRTKAQAGMVKVVTALSLGQRLNQNDPEDRKAVDQHFKQLFVPSLDQIPPEQRVGAIFSQINSYGVVPETFATSMITVPLATGSPDQKAQAAQIYARLAQEQPAYAGSNAISDVTRRTAILLNNYREAGMSPEDAARAADTDLKIEGKTGHQFDEEYRRVIANGQGKPTKSQDFLRSQFDEGWLSASPALQAGVANAFDNIAAHEYATNGGNLDLAQKAALDKLKTQYGLSRVNGSPVIMRHAPESFYGLPGLSLQQNSMWIRQQAVDDLNRNSAAPIPPENVQIVPYVTATGRAVTGPDGKPAYALTVIGPDGLPYPQMDYTPGSPNYGKPLAWVPDSERQTQDLNGARDLRNQYDLDVARLNRDNQLGTLKPGEYLQRKRDLLTKYGFSPQWSGSLEVLSPMVRPKPDKRSENQSGNSVGGPDTGPAPSPTDYGDEGDNASPQDDAQAAADAAQFDEQAARRRIREKNAAGRVPAAGESFVDGISTPVTQLIHGDTFNGKPATGEQIRQALRDAPDSAPTAISEGDFANVVTNTQGRLASASPREGAIADVYRGMRELRYRQSTQDEEARASAHDAKVRALLTSMQQSYTEMNRGLVDWRNTQRTGTDKIAAENNASEADLSRRLSDATSREDKFRLIQGLTEVGLKATPARRREILKQLDQHFADATWIQKAMIMQLHIADARDRGLDEVFGEDARNWFNYAAPRAP